MASSLIAEAKRRMEAEAAARSLINDNKTWWKEHWEEVGNLDYAGMWMGKRRQFSEGYKRDIVFAAILRTDFTLEDAFALLTDAQIKKLVKDKRWGSKLSGILQELDPEDEGMVRIPGKYNYEPVKNEPNPNNYEIAIPKERTDAGNTAD